MPTDSNNEHKSSILKSTREAKGLTLEIVHEATKIPMDALKAIEEGYSVRILSPFYYRGFIKIYSEFLGLDIKEMYKQYGLDQPVASSSIVKQKPAKIQRAPALPSLALEKVQGSVTTIFNLKNLGMVLKVVGFVLLLLLIFKMVGCVASHFPKKGFSSRINKVRINDEGQQERAVPLQSENKHEAVQAQSVDNKVEVAVRANRNTYLQVKTDGHVVFQMTLSKGSMESWSADDRIELSGRNIEQLDMEVNGKHIGSLGGGERRIRRVLITQEGLTVKK